MTPPRLVPSTSSSSGFCRTGSNSPIARFRLSSNLGCRSCAAGLSRSHNQHRDDDEIGQAVHELIGAERVPEAPVLRSPAVTLHNLLLEPIDVIVHGELGQCDASNKQQRSGHQHEIHEGREGGMDTGMQEAAGMPVSPLVQKLVRSLQIEIGYGMLGHQDRDGGKGKNRELWHLIYLDRASAVLSQVGGGGLFREKAIRAR